MTLVRVLPYNMSMARGWESKAIEDQISAAEAKQEARAKSAMTEREIEREKRRRGLLLERTRLVRQMQEARDDRYVALLQRALQHVDAELAGLGTKSPAS